MADSYSLALQKALIAHLRADAGMQALVAGRVFGSITEGNAYPFAIIGGKVARPMRSDCGKAAMVTFSIEGHAKPPLADGSAPATMADRIGEAAVAALEGATLTVAGFEMVTLRWVTGPTTAPATDGQTYESVTAFSTLLDG
jgi:hypothetical protein